MQISRVKRVALLVTLCLVAASCRITSARAPGHDDASIALPAEGFVDSVGINTHLYYFDTSYGNWPRTRALIGDLGIRHIRDGGVVLAQPTYVRRLQDLHSAFGVRVMVNFDPRSITPAQAVVLAKSIGAAVSAAEAPNEFDTQANWPSRLVSYSDALRQALDSDHATARIPMVGPSFIRFESSDTIAGTLPEYEFGNMHPYEYPGPPAASHVAREMAQRVKPTPGRPMMATEVGWHTGPSGSRGVSEIVQAKYLSRMFLGNYRQGVERTYSYELLDEWDRPGDPESRFGIVRFDGTPKPAYYVLKNLLSLLEDPGPPFAPSSLQYSLVPEGVNPVRTVLLEKRDGSLWIAAWVDVASTDGEVTTHATLDIGTPATLTTYIPMEGTTASAPQSGTSFPVTVTDHPTLFRLAPTG